MLGFWDCPAELFIRFAVSCIEPVITSHLEMFFGDMLYEKGDEIQYRNCFFYIGIILVFIVVEGHIITIVRINAGGGNNRASEVTADVFYDRVSVAEVGLGINIETIFILFINGRFSLFKRRTDMGLKLVKESGLKGFTQISIVEMFNDSPEAIIRETAFGKETVDVRIPFERSAKGMEYADKAGHKVFGFVHFMEEPENDTADGLKKAVKERAVIQKERAQVFIDGKNEVPMCTINEFKGHFSRAVNTVFIATGGAKLRMAAERDKFKFATVRTGIHRATKRRIPTVDHFFNVFHDNGTGMKSIFNFFIVFFKNLL